MKSEKLIEILENAKANLQEQQYEENAVIARLQSKIDSSKESLRVMDADIKSIDAEIKKLQV